MRHSGPESEVGFWKEYFTHPDYFLLVRSSSYFEGTGSSVGVPCEHETDSGYEALLAYKAGKPNPGITPQQLCELFQSSS